MQAERTMEESILLRAVSEIKRKHRYMGVRKIYQMLQPDLLEHGIKIGRDGLYTLLWQNGMLIRKRRRKSTTNSNHTYKIYDNIIKGRQATGPNQIWVSDITYIPVKKGFVYLSLLTDAYSRKILGYNVSESLHTKGPAAALSMAIGSLDAGYELIHHSDRGIQYSSKEYTDVLNQAGITISMSRSGEPIDNAIAERINGIIKHEYLKGQVLDAFETAVKAIKNAIELYNNERPHLSCGMQTPNEAHKGEIELTNLWKRL
jgi:transposase InsO family protein